MKEQRIRSLVFVISGPSGSGKTTLRDELLKDKELRRKLIKSISFTTRPQRSGEKNKREYLFIAKYDFKAKLKAKKLLEWTKYLGYYYATPKAILEGELKKSKHIIMCLDLKGVLRIKRLYPENTVTIFIIPPSLKALRARIQRRCHKTKRKEIIERLRIARTELVACHKYDYCVVNKNLAQAVRELKGIILGEILLKRGNICLI